MAKLTVQGYKAEARVGDDGKPREVEVFVSCRNHMEIHLSCKASKKNKGYPVRLRLRRLDAMRLVEEIISRLGDIWESDETGDE